MHIDRIMSIRSKRARAVKGFDSKSNGLSPRRFESCRLRSFAGGLLAAFYERVSLSFLPLTSVFARLRII